MMTWFRYRPDVKDLLAIALLYLALVSLFRLAFAGLGTEREIALFLVFAVAGLLLTGVVGPVSYTVFIRGRSLDSLGVTSRRWKESLALGLVLGGLQYVLTFTVTGLDLPPDPVNWVPLLAMSLMVGLFEAIFFRGFIQNRLEENFGVVPSIVGAAGLYSLYHFGYMMGPGEMAFLFGLGIAFAVVFRFTRNILILWPFFTPLGAFFNNLRAGDILLPWMSVLGFADVLIAIGVVLFIAQRMLFRKQKIATGSARTPDPSRTARGKV